MRILITGGAGMVGSHAAEYYARRGEEVVVLDNLMRSKLFGYDKKSVEFNWNYLAKYKNVLRVKGDVREKADVLKAIGKGVDLCIHTAGQPGVGLSCKEPLEDFSINAFGTLNVLEALRKTSKDASLVYCSTNKVFGENVDKIKLKELAKRYIYEGAGGVAEDMPIDLTGHTPYGASKYTGDIYTQEYARIYGMRTAVFRMSCTYGIRQFGFEDQGWVAHFVISNLIKRPVTIFGNGKQVRDLLYVEDLIDAFDK
ncbi:MAG: NAD-dependent epimerase/dehydratase family protein, partial [Candidatus Omnitrophica bacterium]|nr:NAD-dependent epimerase/dehydratase family protein [Candidatus Omnitrophota bacterium]